MQKIDNSPRRDFLRKIPIALISISALSIFKFKKSKSYSELKYNIVSKSEAEEIIKQEKFSASKYLKPAPAPRIKQDITG
jgi:hypothetical protein